MHEHTQSTHGHRGVAHPKLSLRTQIRATHIRPRQHPPVGNRFVSFVRARAAVCKVRMDLKIDPIPFPFSLLAPRCFPLTPPPPPNPPIQL